MNIKEISKRNYEATKRRGLITEKTTFMDFIHKIDEEVNELIESGGDQLFDEKELADIALVCFAMAEHYQVDLMKVMELKTIYNEKRK